MQRLSSTGRNWRQKLAGLAPDMTAEQRRVAAITSATHALHDGYTDLMFIMLPLWQTEFALSYAALGALRGVLAGTMACMQIPSGVVSERYGAATVLGLGTALAGLGYCLAGASVGFVTLLGTLVVGGIGSSTQHPIGSSLVARAFTGRRSLKALGTYNFSGDLGKMTLPATLSLLLLAMPWRPALALLGAIGFVMAAAILIFTPRYDEAAVKAPHAAAAASDRAAVPRRAFPLLLSIGVIDTATRMGFLLFLPFLLGSKGASLQTVGLAMTLVFAGSAAGKLACAFIGARLGTIATVWLTEGLTAVGILVLFMLPLAFALLLLPVLGIALNGTSSVLYGSVPDLVPPHWRTRALSIFYTGTIGAGALSPILFGRIGDALGVSNALMLVAGFVLLTLPLAGLLRGAFAAAYGTQAA